MNNIRIKYLLDRQADQLCTESETEELRMLLHSPENKEMFLAALHQWITVRDAKNVMPEKSTSDVLEAIFQSDNRQTLYNAPAPRVHFLRTAWFRSIAAAMLILTIGTIAYLWNIPNKPAADMAKPVTAQNDVKAPSANRAMITLANGKKIYLDSAMNGKLATEGSVNIQKMDDGQIVYNKAGDVSKMEYNTLTVPRGSQVAHLTLADGSKVFLNAASSITYPVAFIGSERRVEITGEAYFEVAKDPRKKFIVSGGGLTTEVLGTHFNVNTYADEASTKITLLEGRIEVKRNEEKITIRPGEQVESSPQTKLLLNQHADLTQVMAWQKGMFVFTDMSLPAILRQVGRWYDVTIRYEGTLPATSYGGGLSRNLPLSEVIKLLESEKVKFTLNDNTLTVQPK